MKVSEKAEEGESKIRGENERERERERERKRERGEKDSSLAATIFHELPSLAR